MIVFSKLGSKGRLGNQMFQYAGLRGIAHALNSDWKIPKTGTDDYSLFDVFKMKSVKPENFLDSPSTLPIVKSTKFSYDKRYLELDLKSFDIDNYLQSYKYFENIEDEIRKDFTFKKRFATIKRGDFIFMHVRRGDYTKLQDYHPLCPVSYYNEALKRFPKDIQVKVFSDDLDWCRETFKGDRFVIKKKNDTMDNSIQLPTGKTHSAKPHADLFEMSKCKGGIIANSSFSWWGAWLIKDPQYPIVAPAPWFGPRLNHDTSDLIPENWITIDWRKI